jgi:hypothetical protein
VIISCRRAVQNASAYSTKLVAVVAVVELDLSTPSGRPVPNPCGAGATRGFHSEASREASILQLLGAISNRRSSGYRAFVLPGEQRTDASDRLSDPLLVLD